MTAPGGPAAVVRSTYRVQVSPAFDLDATAGLAGYLAALGVSHVYTAPLLTAAPGAAHGYDVVDHSAVDARIGGETGRRRLAAALREHRLGLVVDIVPNHMSVAVPAANRAWWDVLCRGPSSPYADWFDIDWSRGRLVIPVLADDDALDDLRLVDGELRYHGARFPVADGTGTGTPREVHDRQRYELVSWRRANAELNYRRFFAVNELAGLRVEDPAVFDATHAEVLRWYAAGDVDGIRVDHPDGLADPTGYLRRLRDRAPRAWLVAEKILEYGEALPDWPVAGTTGYDALREVCGLFVDPAAEAAFTDLDALLTGQVLPWHQAAYDAKAQVSIRLFAAELRRLERLVHQIPRAFAALAEIAASFPVYRSYVPDGEAQLGAALDAARRRRPGLASTVDALATRLDDPAEELAVRFQQLTGAVMAKGVEDTAAYRWTRFVALNEVGGDPSRFGVGVPEFHAASAMRQRYRPDGMTTLSTHDTKRGEDVRARLAVLSELPAEWSTTVQRWMSAAPLPDPALAHLLWQTVAGAWPIGRARLHRYAQKAAREASVSTSWYGPDAAFEWRLHEVVDAVYDDPGLRADVDGFVAAITRPGWSNALGQKLVQLAMPGVPDTYQGTELWDDSLVDPDNRRPVGFAARRDLLVRIDSGWLPPVDATGAAKLLVTSRTLRLRRDRPDLFAGYTPVDGVGPAAAHVVAFDRGGAVAVATRLPVGLARLGGWTDTALAMSPGGWTDALTARPVGAPLLASILDTYPVALLVRA